MRCVDVTRELATPSGRLDPSALAEHLAACPACASWSARADRLDRLWEATRPAGPPAGAFDTVWAEVDRAAEAATLPLPPRARRRVLPWLVAAGIAQAAAAALIVAALPRDRDGNRPAPAAPPRVVRSIRVEIAEGQIVMIPVDGRDGVKVVDLPPEAVADTIAPDFDLLNEFEAMATTSMASL